MKHISRRIVGRNCEMIVMRSLRLLPGSSANDSVSSSCQFSTYWSMTTRTHPLGGFRVLWNNNFVIESKRLTYHSRRAGPSQ